MEIFALLIPGLLTGLAALIAALAALFKKDERVEKNTEVQSAATDVIEKLVDGQNTINRMLLERIKEQDDEIALMRKELDDRSKDPS